jgi:hypothetical protein
MDAYWRACNYLCAGMIYLRDNPLLRKPLLPEHFKNRLLGHWGSDPGQTFAWVHLNRVIRKYELDMIYRLQDCQSHDPGPHHAGRTRKSIPRMRLDATRGRGRGRRSGVDASGDGGSG